MTVDDPAVPVFVVGLTGGEPGRWDRPGAGGTQLTSGVHRNIPGPTDRPTAREAGPVQNSYMSRPPLTPQT
jgi:hypothetical protein